jgi:ABC-2 type transport system permease protein
MAGIGLADQLARGGVLGELARRQYAALAAMRWQMFKNGLRTSKGALELGARAFSYLTYTLVGLGLSTGLGFGAFAIITSGHVKYLSILFWAVFLIWQLLPVLLASFQEQFDLGVLLRFPLRFSSYILLYLIFGLVDVSTITGALCSLGLWVGITVAEPGMVGWAALGLAIFAAFNVLLVRAIFAWVDRWLAQRRTREIVGAIFLVFVLSLQLLNPALHQSRRSPRVSRAERAADAQKTMAEARPWLRRADAIQRWLPPGLAAQTVRFADSRQAEPALDSAGLLGMYALVAGLVLAARLNSEFAGENLGEAPSRKKSASRPSADRHGWMAQGSGPIGALMEKELRALLRTLPLLYAVGAPLLLVLVFSGAFIRNGPQSSAFQLTLPICLVYVQLGFTQLFYNCFGTEGMGVQLYFLSPTSMRTVLLAKNLFASMLFGLAAVVAGVLTSLRLGMPRGVVVSASVGLVLFALISNLAAGNVFSITMAYRINPGRLTRQRGSQANSLLSVLVQLGVIGVGAAVFVLCWALQTEWLATPVFLALAAVALVLWRVGLGKSDALANAHRDDLIAAVAKMSS